MFKYIIYSYINYLSYFFFALGLSLLLLGICYLLSTSSWYFEKITSYECGFNPFSDTREPFEIKFYLIAILFIIFDVEVIFFSLSDCSERIITFWLLHNVYFLYNINIRFFLWI